MFTRDIRRITDADLSAHVRKLIETREPESLYLDYKQVLDVTKESSKKELAKDISSFANEQGGMVIYGVPEVRDGDLPRPKPIQECGMVIDPELAKRIEDILLSAVQPPLHAPTIKLIDIEEIAPKQLLLVYHPESYWKPHMVQGYRDSRYYRRSNFQVVKMSEREVEAAYRGREASRRHAADFFERGLFGPADGVQIRAVACPVLPGRFKDHMLQPGFRDWLTQNQPMALDLPPDGRWLPFLDGWRFLGTSGGGISGSKYEVRLFHNGAVCLNLDANATCVDDRCLFLDQLRSKLSDLFLRYCRGVLSALGISGPLVLQMTVTHTKGLKCVRDHGEFEEMNDARKGIQAGSRHVRFRGQACHAVEDIERPYLEGNQIVFEEESSADEILEQPDDILGRLMTRIGTAFGLWGDEED